MASFDGGKVRVTWDGHPFTADNASITGTDPAHIDSTTVQTFIRKANNTTPRAGSVTHGILVNL